MARTALLCDQIVDFLNTEEFTLSFVAKRENIWFVSGTDTKDIHVVVVPAEVETTPQTRGDAERKYTVNLFVQMDGAATRDRQDQVIELVEEIEDRLYMQAFSGFYFDSMSDRGSRLVVDTEAMARYQMFLVTLTITYRGE